MPAKYRSEVSCFSVGCLDNVLLTLLVVAMLFGLSLLWLLVGVAIGISIKAGTICGVCL